MDFRPLFVNALASRNPQPYLAMLAEVIEEQGAGPSDWKRPEEWNYGGTIPAADRWRILFDFVKSRPAAELRAGEFDRSLDALERMHWFGSGEPTSLYALYLSRGLLSRAKEFRDTTRKSAPFDMDLYFDRVDRDSAAYLQWRIGGITRVGAGAAIIRGDVPTTSNSDWGLRVSASGSRATGGTT